MYKQFIFALVMAEKNHCITQGLQHKPRLVSAGFTMPNTNIVKPHFLH